MGDARQGSGGSDEEEEQDAEDENASWILAAAEEHFLELKKQLGYWEKGSIETFMTADLHAMESAVSDAREAGVSARERGGERERERERQRQRKRQRQREGRGGEGEGGGRK